jgi:poly-gamma-glutamate synthesis protein (capsule biosynthesis protein)
VATGDVLIHPPLVEQARADGGGALDFRPLLAGVAPVVSAADLAICHLETPLAPSPDGPFRGYPDFSAPPQIASALRDTGYDTCSTASNHSLDDGTAGVDDTLRTLDAAGVRHVGSARSAAEDAPLITDVRGVRIAQLAATYGFNGDGPPVDEPWRVETIDPDRLLAQARDARAGGAQIVVVSLHGGTEFSPEVTDEQRDLARRLLTDPAVDLVIGHHAHVVQPFERIGDKWAAYGLGNLVARHDPSRGSTEEGLIARFTFTPGPDGRWRVERAEAIPTLIDLGPPIRVLDLTSTPAGPRGDEARRHTAEVVGSLGFPP